MVAAKVVVREVGRASFLLLMFPAAELSCFGSRHGGAYHGNALRHAWRSGSRCPPRSRHTLRSGTLPCEGTAEVFAKARGRSPPSRNPSSAAGAGNAPISCTTCCTRSFGRRGHSISSAMHVWETTPTPCHAYCSVTLKLGTCSSLARHPMPVI